MQTLDPIKAKFIERIQAELSHVSGDDILPFFLAVQKKANQEHISFTQQETHQLIKSFRNQANETEKKELDLLIQLLELRS